MLKRLASLGFWLPTLSMFKSSGTAFWLTRSVPTGCSTKSVVASSFRKRFSIFAVSLFNHFMVGAAVSKSLLSAQSKQQYQPFAEKVTVGQESYTVAYQADNKAYTSSATFTSEAAAHDFMQQTIAADPNQAETLHVIPQFEVKS